LNYLLVWDIDGTLIQGRGIGKRAMDRAFLEIYGIEEGFEGIDMGGRLDAMILKEAYLRHGIKNADSARYFRSYLKYLEEEVKKLDYDIDAPGIISLLNELNSKDGFYNVLGTGNVERAARIKLSVHDMNRFFPTGGFGDKALERWQVIEKAIYNSTKEFGREFAKNNVYVIGDTPRDIECGKIIGAHTVGVATGSYSSRELRDCCADHVFENFTNAADFLSIFS